MRHLSSKSLLVGCLASLSLFLAFVGDACADPEVPAFTTQASFSVKSSAFQNSGELPIKHSCLAAGSEDPGAGMSPALTWKNLPAATSRIAILATDSDADTFALVHSD